VERLARIGPSNAYWQGDLSLCHKKIGDAFIEQENLAAAFAPIVALIVVAAFPWLSIGCL
jgi:hypothetical protein